jgi:5-methylcytosine-specific restriction endonuclease McrA
LTATLRSSSDCAPQASNVALLGASKLAWATFRQSAVALKFRGAMPTMQADSFLTKRLRLPPEHQERMRGIIAATVATISDLRPDWYLARLNGTHLRVYFGHLIVITLEGPYVWASIDELAVVGRVERLSSWSWDEPVKRPVKGKAYPRYRRPASRNGFYDPAKDPSGVEWEILEPAHHAFLRRVAREGRAPDHRTKSDHDVVKEIQTWAPFGARESVFERAVREALRDSTESRRARLANAPRKATVRVITTLAFNRNPDVIAEVLLRAGGYCEACGQPAPFTRASDGTPYLEVHHRVRLADGGDDTVENAIALCPNCHRKQHYG